MAGNDTTQVGFSYEMGLDVFDPNGTGSGEGEGTGEWLPVRFITSLDPQFAAKTVDGPTYDDLGADNPIKIGESGTLTVTVQDHRDSSGNFLPEVELLLAACLPDKRGDAATVRARYYDKPEGTKAPNSNYAFEFLGSVSEARAATGVAEAGGKTFTLSAKGPRTQITNPYTGAGEGEGED